MSDVTLQFDVRNHVSRAERYNAIVQAEFDTFNRMAAILDGISFGELLTEPFGTLMPRIIANVDRTAECGLLDDPKLVKDLMSRLGIGLADETFENISRKADREGYELPHVYFRAVWRLWFHHGVRLPEFSRNTEHPHNRRAKEAISSMIADASDFDYPLIATVPGSKDTVCVRIAVNKAVESMIIYLPHNGLCCTCGGGCQCIGGLYMDNCFVQYGICTTGSSLCGSDAVRHL